EAPELSDGLPDWLLLYDRFATEFPGMSAHVGGLADDQSPVAGACGPMKDRFARLWNLAQREGRARRDVSATQALALISSLPKDPATGRTAKPYLDVALEGLRVLTGSNPPPAAATHRAAGRGALHLAALTQGYTRGFLVIAALSVLGAVCGVPRNQHARPGRRRGGFRRKPARRGDRLNRWVRTCIAIACSRCVFDAVDGITV